MSHHLVEDVRYIVFDIIILQSSFLIFDFFFICVSTISATLIVVVIFKNCCSKLTVSFVSSVADSFSFSLSPIQNILMIII